MIFAMSIFVPSHCPDQLVKKVSWSIFSNGHFFNNGDFFQVTFFVKRGTPDYIPFVYEPNYDHNEYIFFDQAFNIYEQQSRNFSGN